MIHQPELSSTNPNLKASPTARSVERPPQMPRVGNLLFSYIEEYKLSRPVSCSNTGEPPWIPWRLIIKVTKKIVILYFPTVNQGLVACPQVISPQKTTFLSRRYGTDGKEHLRNTLELTVRTWSELNPKRKGSYSKPSIFRCYASFKGCNLNGVNLSILRIYHLESRWRNSHVLVYHGPLLSHLLAGLFCEVSD